VLLLFSEKYLLGWLWPQYKNFIQKLNQQWCVCKKTLP